MFTVVDGHDLILGCADLRVRLPNEECDSRSVQHRPPAVGHRGTGEVRDRKSVV